MQGVLIFVCLLAVAAAVPQHINNDVTGTPNITCGSTEIGVNLDTAENFEGHLYAKDKYNDTACRTDAATPNKPGVGISLPFDSCGVVRTPSANGVNVSVSVIIKFHPIFKTYKDRSYEINCFYGNSDNPLNASLTLNVSNKTAEKAASEAELPTCAYDIYDKQGGSTITTANVGDKVYHGWSCTGNPDTFCMVVHDCDVNHGPGTPGGNEVLVDTNGCAQDFYLMDNLIYSGNLSAGVEGHVFKYAEQTVMNFNCKVAVMVKNPGQPCPLPSCVEPAGRGGPKPAGTLITVDNAYAPGAGPGPAAPTTVEPPAAKTTLGRRKRSIVRDAAISRDVRATLSVF